MSSKILQRHCVIQMNDTGDTIKEFRFPDLRSPWTQSHDRAMYFIGYLKDMYSDYNLEIVSENFEVIPAAEFGAAIPCKQKEWIETNVLDTADGLCLEWAGLMCQVFPELQLMYGEAVCFNSQYHSRSIAGNNRYARAPHFWCQTPRGVIVDPTAGQFVNLTSYANGRPAAPYGFCEVCGAVTYGSGTRCSVYCYAEEEGVKWDEEEQWPFAGTNPWNRLD